MSSKNGSIILMLIVFLAGFQAGMIYAGGETFLGAVNDYELGNGQEEGVVGESVVNYTGDEIRNKVFQESRDSVVSINPSRQNLDGFDEEVAVGSGFVFDSEGYILTNYHVVEGFEQFDVTFLDDATDHGELVAADPYTDLAVLRVDLGEELPELEISKRDFSVGDSVLAIGNPFGLEGSMTSGIVSHTNRMIPGIDQFSIPNMVQIDAPINPGNSGGPLLNLEGEVIGINTAINTQDATFSGVGFAVPASTISRVVPELINQGYYEHPWLGVSGVDVTPVIADEEGLEDARGFMVLEVVEDSPADDAGLKGMGDVTEFEEGGEVPSGDIIVGIDGERITQLHEMLSYLATEVEVGDTVVLDVIRDGEQITVELTLDARPGVN